MTNTALLSTVLLLFVAAVARGNELQEPDDDIITACRVVKSEFEQVAEAYGNSDLAVQAWVKGANDIDPVFADYQEKKKWPLHNPNAGLSKKVIHFYNIRWEAFLRIITGGLKNKGKMFHNAWRVSPQFDDSDRPDFGPAGIASAKKNFSPHLLNYHENDWVKCFTYFAYYVRAK